MRNILFLFLTVSLFSCIESTNDEDIYEAKNSIDDVNNVVSNKSNLETIKPFLDVFLEMQKSSKVNMLYECSEFGGYNSVEFLGRGYYLRPEMLPSGEPEGSDLLSYLKDKYYHPESSGSNGTYVNFEFDIYGVENYTYLNQINVNRLYNEFICKLLEESNYNGTSRVFYNLNFDIDYMMCCDGNTCCYPEISVWGYVYR